MHARARLRLLRTRRHTACSQLCEVIVKVLRSMSCPHPLQAHQIQGNDYVACFPVVQWLVKTVLEYRAITGDYVRTASQSAFYRTFSPWLTREDAASAHASSSLLVADADRTLTSAVMPQEKVCAPSSFLPRMTRTPARSGG